MSAAPSALHTTNVADHIDDEKRIEEPGSDANTMVEKNDTDGEKTDGEKADGEKTDGENDPEIMAVAEEHQLAPDEYPKGFPFVFILISLMLSMFMIALDLVSVLLHLNNPRLISRADNRGNGYPKDYRSVSQCFPDRMVRLSVLPDGCYVHWSLGQALQVLPREVDLFGLNVHLRAGKSYLWYVSHMSHCRNRPLTNLFSQPLPPIAQL